MGRPRFPPYGGRTFTSTCSTNRWRRSFGSPRHSRWRRFFSCPSCRRRTDRLKVGRRPPKGTEYSVLERGDVAWVLAQFLGLQHPPHDLARASLGERRDGLDFLRDRNLSTF